MPRRTNIFQQVVRVIHEHLAAGAATVDESAELLDRVTGDTREVDVTLTSEVAGHQIIISIEATAQKRRATVAWVDGMLSKHNTLPTDKLVLVSQAGFSQTARSRAAAHGAVTLQPRDLATEDVSSAVIGRLGTFTVRATRFKTLSSIVSVRRPDGKVVELKSLSPNTVIVAGDHSIIGRLGDDFAARFDKHTIRILSAVILPQLKPTFYAEFSAECDSRHVEIIGADGSARTTPTYLPVRNALTPKIEDATLYPIERIRHRNRLDVESLSVSLAHLKLDEPVAAHYGTIDGELVGQKALLVITEHDGQVQASVRYADGTTTAISVEDDASRQRLREEAIALVEQSEDPAS